MKTEQERLREAVNLLKLATHELPEVEGQTWAENDIYYSSEAIARKITVFIVEEEQAHAKPASETRTPEQIEREDYPYSAGAAHEKDWGTAEPWRRLSSDAGLQPGEEMRFAIGPVTGPFLVKSIVAMPYSLDGVRVEIFLNGRFCLIEDARFDVERTIETPTFLILPGMSMMVNVKNAGNEPGAFRALICGRSIGPAQALEFWYTRGYEPIDHTALAGLYHNATMTDDAITGE